MSHIHTDRTIREGRSKLMIISLVFVFTTIFYVYSVGSYFGIEVFPLQNRENNLISFDAHVIGKDAINIMFVLGTVIWLELSLIGRTRIIVPAIYGGIILAIVLANPELLAVVSLVSIPIMMSLLIFNRFSSRKILNISMMMSASYFAIASVVVSVVSIIVSTAPFFLTKSIPLYDYANDIFLLFSTISPVLIFCLITCSPLKLLVPKFFDRIKIKNNTFLISIPTMNLKIKILLISSFMLLSVIMTLIPHQPAINTTNGQIGADSAEYVKIIETLTQSKNAQGFLQETFVNYYGGDRSISLVLFTAFTKIMPIDISYAVDHIPIILGPLIVLAAYFLTRELTSSEPSSLLASFLTAISFQTLIGIYSGIYANWLALIFGYFSLMFLIKFLKKPDRINLAAFGAFLILLLFSHAYTWTLLTIFMFVLLAILYKLNHYQKRTIFLLAIVLTASVVIDVTRMEITGNPEGIERDLSLSRQQGAGLQQISLIWTNLSGTMLNYSGGQFGNFIVLALGLYWIFHSPSRDLSSIFLLAFLSIGIIPLFFGDVVIQTRVFYDIPLQIPAAIALTYLLKKNNGILIVSSICIWLFAISIRMVSNF